MRTFAEIDPFDGLVEDDDSRQESWSTPADLRHRLESGERDLPASAKHHVRRSFFELITAWLCAGKASRFEAELVEPDDDEFLRGVAQYSGGAFRALGRQQFEGAWTPLVGSALLDCAGVHLEIWVDEELRFTTADGILDARVSLSDREAAQLRVHLAASAFQL